jgi:HEAT repeats
MDSAATKGAKVSIGVTDPSQMANVMASFCSNFGLSVRRPILPAVVGLLLAATIISLSLLHRRDDIVVMPGAASGWISTKHFDIYGLDGKSDAAAWNKLGSNAIPTLLAALQKRDPLLREVYLSVYHDAPYFIRNNLPRPGKGADEIRAGAAALVLGNPTNAKPLVPSLLEILKVNHYDGVRSWAVDCLGAIGENNEETISILRECLRDRDMYVRFGASNALMRINPDVAAKAGVKRNPRNVEDGVPGNGLK